MGHPVSDRKEVVTVEDLKKALPSKAKLVTQEAADLINRCINEPEFQGESLLKTVTTYEDVLNRNRTTIKDYINAIRFCAYLESTDESYTEAYKKTFFERKFVQERLGLPTDHPKYKELVSAASRYSKSKLVVDVMTLSQVPLDLMFRGYRYKAIGVLADRMENSRLDRDKINAAKELLAATKGPENAKIELNVGVTESSAVQELNEQLAVLAARQKNLLEAGASTVDEFGALKIKEKDNVIEGEIIE